MALNPPVANTVRHNPANILGLVSLMRLDFHECANTLAFVCLLARPTVAASRNGGTGEIGLVA
jgi:hypothetical protein